MRASLKATLAGVCFLATPLAAISQTSYVTERFEITMRRGPGVDFKILELLPSGTALEVMEETEGWTKVRTRAGSEGWVVSRYVTQEPPKGPRLAAAQKEVASLREEIAGIETDLQGSRNESSDLAAQVQDLQGRLETATTEFAEWKQAHEDVIAIRERADALESEQEANRTELERLRTENSNLQMKQNVYWFFSGVVVLLLGWFLGYVYSSSKSRAKSQSRFKF